MYLRPQCSHNIL